MKNKYKQELETTLVYICPKCGKGMLNSKDTRKRHEKYCRGIVKLKKKK